VQRIRLDPCHPFLHHQFLLVTITSAWKREFLSPQRARSAGVGLLIATQSPGDLDYKCRDNVGTWFVGRVAEQPAIEKMKPFLSEARTNVSGKLAGAKTGEFFLLRDSDVTEIKANRAFLDPEQVPEDEILTLARALRVAEGSSIGSH